MVISLASCDLSWLPVDIPGITDGNGDTDTDDGTDDGTDVGDVELDGIVLIKDGKANFKIVTTSDIGASGARAVDEFVAKLTKLGVEVDKQIMDKNASDVTECEIIVGTNVKHREDCVVTDKHLGKEGYIIKAVGKRIVVAGGTSEMTAKALNSFTTSYMKITSKTTEISSIAVAEDLFEEKLTKYLLSSIKVNGIDLSEYTLVLDVESISEEFGLEAIKAFRNDLYDESGYWLDNGSSDRLDEYEHKLVIRYTDTISSEYDPKGEGFAIHIDENNDIYVECAYANAFDDAFAEFADKEILGEMGNIDIKSINGYTAPVSKVFYSDFGAKGDGRTDDFDAIYNAHVYANQGGQKVFGDPGKVYYIGEKFVKNIPVKTDVDFRGAKFVINDEGSTAFKYREIGFFNVARDYEQKTLNEAQIDELLGTDIKIRFGDTDFSWLASVLEAKSLVRIENKYHKDFIRHGSNQNNGSNRQDIFVVDADGKVAENTEVCFEFDEITKIEIWRVDDDPITIENGEFENICCKTVPETQLICLYRGYKRGFNIYRSNVTMRNIKHTMVDEPILNVNADYDKKGEYKTSTGTYGTRDESYPYYGFFMIYTNYNFNAFDCILDGHTVYYEDKPATASTGGVVPNPVPMGSYDLIIEYSSETHLTNVVQQDNEGTGLGDSRYWGIMSSNKTKNIFFTGVQVNRFDAHQGFYNATLIDTVLGHSFNVVGGGKLYCKNVTKITGATFISLRGDYGATFNGDMELIDCEHIAMNSYYSNKRSPGKEDYDKIYSSSTIITSGYSTSNSGGISYKKDENGDFVLDANGEKIIDRDGRYWYWDFGYTCYMPRNVILKNFKSRAKSTFVFNDLPNDIFSKEITNTYMLTESVTFINMDRLPLSAGTGRVINSIPVTVKEE